MDPVLPFHAALLQCKGSAREKSRLPRDSFLSDSIPSSPEARIPNSNFRHLLKSVALHQREEREKCEPCLPLQLSHGLD